MRWDMRNKGQADKKEIELAAIHECGHGLVTESFGLRIYQIAITRDAGGFCESDLPLSPIKDLKITLAGYVAECLMRGEVPSFEAMRVDITCEDDVDEVDYLLSDGRINAERALPLAMQSVHNYLTIPSVERRLRRLAARLVRTRRLDGRIFKG
jgi:hypothetical protein